MTIAIGAIGGWYFNGFTKPTKNDDITNLGPLRMTFNSLELIRIIRLSELIGQVINHFCNISTVKKLSDIQLVIYKNVIFRTEVLSSLKYKEPT